MNRKFSSWSAALVITSALFAPPRAIALTKTFTVPFDQTWSNFGWGCGQVFPILQNGSYSTSFSGALPFGSKVTQVTLTVPMRRAGLVSPVFPSADPLVDFSIDGQAMGSSVVPGYVECPFAKDLIAYTFTQSFANGFAGWNSSGTQSLSVTVANGTCPNYCGVTMADGLNPFVPMAQVDVEYTAGYEVVLAGGDAQVGATGGPLELPLSVQLTTPDPQPKFEGKTVVFTVKSAAGAGAAVGVDELATTQTYTATANASGRVDAVLVMGNKAGTYTVEASSPLSVTNKPVTFTASAQKPDRVVVSKDDPEPAAASATYAVSLLRAPRFYALGVNAQGAKIGRVKCAWSAVGKGKVAGSATLNPTATPASAVTFTPTALGKMTMGANPSVSGLSTAHADVLISGIYVQVNPNTTFDPKVPVDDLPNFVPGADLAGNNLALPVPADGTKEIQTVTLHLLTDPGIAGTVTYHLSNVSHFPGVAMNWPVQNAGVGADLDFGAGAASNDATKQSTPAIPLNAQTGDTTVKLYVYDYGANGQLTATVTTTKQTYTITATLPKDDDGNGLPDAGWKTPFGTVDSTTISAAADDVDALSPSTTPNAPTPTQPGDGFSAFEEYRGFVANGAFERLDPKMRDLFIDADQSVDTSFIKTQLPYRLHFIIAGESLAPDVQRGSAGVITRTAPVMDPNRQSVPGAAANGQRGLRLVYQNNDLLYPTDLDTSDGNYYPSWQFGVLANTWQDGLAIDHIKGLAVVPFATLSPNKIRFVEVLARTETNAAIAISTNAYATSAQPIYKDASGQPVPDCSTAAPGVDCDNYHYNLNVVGPQVLPSNANPQRAILHSRLTYPNDYYTKAAFPCGVPQTAQNLTIVSQADFTFLRGLVVGHEVGHYLALDHTSSCGDLMFGGASLMPDSLPYPTKYQPTEITPMRTHQ
jgi:hypothetical protein